MRDGGPIRVIEIAPKYLGTIGVEVVLMLEEGCNGGALPFAWVEGGFDGGEVIEYS